MRILVVGAGAIGGYFGGRLVEAGSDVTFLVRPRRAEQLRATGLVVRSRFGNVHVPEPNLALASDLTGAFDLILVSCKAYDLADTMDAIAPAVSAETTILPLLNGLQHLDALDERFGDDAVLGGECMISAAVGPDGAITHLNDLHLIVFGERSGERSARIESIAEAFVAARFESRVSDRILHEMWEKWVFIAALGGINAMLRGTIGDIHSAGLSSLAASLYEECCVVAGVHGFPPSEEAIRRSKSILTTPGSPLTASLLKDIERGARTEGDHIIGDLNRRGGERGVITRLLRVANAHVRTYEARRARERAAEATG